MGRRGDTSTLFAFLKWISFGCPIRLEIGRNNERFYLLVTQLVKQLDGGTHVGAGFPRTTRTVDDHFSILGKVATASFSASRPAGLEAGPPKIAPGM